MWCECTLDRKSDLVNDYLSLFGVFMIEEKGGSAQILERLMSSYGVNTQKDLAAALSIPANNISGWVQRDSVPGNAIIKCALDTGTDLQWLVTGELAKPSSGEASVVHRGAPLYNEITSNGGKSVLRRIMDAYGFTLQKQLCEFLGISSGTVSTWVRRNYFPGDVVITCALDTGVSLKWLATGHDFDSVTLNGTCNSVQIPKINLEGGKLTTTGMWSVDKSFFYSGSAGVVYIEGVTHSWLVNEANKSVGNGRWVINIDGSYDVYDLVRLPGNKLKLSNSKVSLECNSEDVSTFGMVIFTIERHI